MLGLEIIKQTLENSAKKPSINPNIVKKLALSRISSDIRFSNQWVIREEIDKIIGSKLSDEIKRELIEFLKSECYNVYEKTKKELNEIFGEEKQESVKADEDSGTKGEKEEIGKSGEGEESEEAQDDPKDDKKTPAEYVNEQKPGQSLFQY